MPVSTETRIFVLAHPEKTYRQLRQDLGYSTNWEIWKTREAGGRGLPEDISFDLVPINHSDDSLLTEGRNLINFYARDRNLIQRHDRVAHLSPQVRKALGFIKPYIHNRFNVDLSQIPQPAILFKDDIEKVNETLIQKIEHSNSVSSFVHGAYIIIDPHVDTALTSIRVAFHEALHGSGRQYFASVKNLQSGVITNIYSRQGIQIFNKHSSLQPWVLEEGIISYLDAEFLKVVADRIPRIGWEDKKRLIENKINNDLVDHRGRISFPPMSERYSDEHVFIEPKYTDVVFLDFGERTIDLVIRIRTALAGSLFEAIINNFPFEEREAFLQLIFSARRDLSLTKKVAKWIEHRCGIGTYAKLIRMPDNHDDRYIEVWNLTKELRNRNAISDRS